MFRIIVKGLLEYPTYLIFWLLIITATVLELTGIGDWGFMLGFCALIYGVLLLQHILIYDEVKELREEIKKYRIE